MLVIEPTITGFDQNPVYKWTVKGPNDAEAAEAGTDKTLSFIQLETGDYTISLTISDDSGITETKSATVTVTTEATAYSYYISEVLEYNPAITNGKGLAFSTIDTPSTVLASVNTKLVDKPFDKNDLGVNLGSFGGSIVFRFDHTVMTMVCATSASVHMPPKALILHKGLSMFRLTRTATARPTMNGTNWLAANTARPANDAT